jgi:hypothetical protein
MLEAAKACPLDCASAELVLECGECLEKKMNALGVDKPCTHQPAVRLSLRRPGTSRVAASRGSGVAHESREGSATPPGSFENALAR